MDLNEENVLLKKENEELKEKIARYEKEPMYRCFACGGELIWNSDFMQSEIEGWPVEDEEHDRVVNILTRKDCGAEVMVYQSNGTDED